MPQVAEILSKKGVQALVFNPCGNQPVSGDFIETMNKNIQTLQN